MESEAADLVFQINKFQIALFVVGCALLVENDAHTFQIGLSTVREIAADGDVAVFPTERRFHHLKLGAGKDCLCTDVRGEQEQPAKGLRRFFALICETGIFPI